MGGQDFKDSRRRTKEDVFSATPPLGMMRFIMSRQAICRNDGRERKTSFSDMKKGHLAPLCEQDVYVELPGEGEVDDDECGKLIHWLCGCRPAAQAWDEHHSALLKEHEFKWLKCVPAAVVPQTRDMSGVVHGDDCVWEGRDEDLDWKNRVRLGLAHMT